MLLSHLRSFKVIQNYTNEYGVCNCKVFLYYMSIDLNICLYCTVTNAGLFIVKCGLGVVQGH